MSRKEIHIFRWSQERRRANQQKISVPNVHVEGSTVSPSVPNNPSLRKQKFNWFEKRPDTKTSTFTEANYESIAARSNDQKAICTDDLTLPFVPADANYWKPKSSNPRRLTDKRTPNLTDNESISAASGDQKAIRIDDLTLPFVPADANYWKPRTSNFSGRNNPEAGAFGFAVGQPMQSDASTEKQDPPDSPVIVDEFAQSADESASEYYGFSAMADMASFPKMRN
jgi:hypothetical protein